MDLRLWLVSTAESVPHIRCCVKAELMIVTEENDIYIYFIPQLPTNSSGP